MARRKIEESIKQKIIDLLTANFPKHEIAKNCGVSVATVFNIAKREKINANNNEIKILNAKINQLIIDNNTLKQDNHIMKNIINNLQQQIEPLLQLAEPALNLTHINSDLHQTEKKLLHIGTNSTQRLRF